MPFFRMDPESYDAMADEMSNELSDEFDAESMGPRPSGDFTFERAHGTFDTRKFGPGAKEVLAVLTAGGATGFVVRYDGGYDEGFSYPEAVLFGDRRESAKNVAAQLANAELSLRLREAAKKQSIWFNAVEMYGQASDQQVVLYGFDELAQEIATVLLGDGFGTGEYELYGELTADLSTGEIVDDPSAIRKGSIGQSGE